MTRELHPFSKLPLLLAALVASLLTFVAQAFAAPRPLDLRGSLRYAIEHSPTLDQALQAHEIAGLNYKTALASFFPSADLAAGAGLTGSTQTSGAPPWSTTAGVTLSETLYDNGQAITRFRMADLGREIARLAFERAREKLTLDVTRAYYQLALNLRLRQVKEQQQQLLEKQFKTVQSQFKMGIKTKQDFLRFKTQLERVNLDLLDARSTIEASEVELKRLLGVPAPEQAADAPELAFAAPEEPAVANVPAQAPQIEKSYEYRLSTAQRRIDRMNEDLVRRKWWPQLNVSGSLGYQFSNLIGGTDSAGLPLTGGAAASQLYWNAQLGLTFNLWDWGTRSRDIEAAERNSRISGDRLDTDVQSARADGLTAVQRLRQLEAETKLDSELLDISQQSFSLLEEQFRLGKATYLDIVNGLADLLDARVRYYTSYYSLLQSLAVYRYDEGRLYETVMGSHLGA